MFLFQRELKLRESEIQKRLEEKDEEGRLEREELELRVKALTRYQLYCRQFDRFNLRFFRLL